MTTALFRRARRGPFRVCGVFGLLSLALSGALAAAETAPRNIILMIGDGMGFGQVSAYRQYIDDPKTEAAESTVFDDMLVGTLATGSSDSTDHITDSAAGATAYACGIKTRNGAVGVTAENVPCRTVLEVAREQGKRTGIVVTSQLTHATPAAFYAHVPSRKMIGEIAGQVLQNQKPAADLLLGGGAEDFVRSRQQLQKAGIVLLDSRADLLRLSTLPALGAFSHGGLPMAIDRADETPNLAEMTESALRLLNNDQRGFFLLIEGSQIDWASHTNDIVGTLSEMRAFAESIALARQFVARHPDTLLIVTADHETGGLSLGRDKQSEWHTSLLRQVQASALGMAKRVLAGEDPVKVLEHLSPINADSEDRKRLQQAIRVEERLEDAFASIIAKHSLTGWTTRGHTGADVPLYAVGAGSAALRGHHENAWLGQQLLRFVAIAAQQRVNTSSDTRKEHAP